MIRQIITLPALLMAAACTFPPQAKEETVTLPTIVVKDTIQKPPPAKVIKVPAIKPVAVEASPVKSMADIRCPPTEGETEQQRVIRKLDCLLERD